MKSSELCAWHYRLRQTVRLQWEAGRLTSIESIPGQPEHPLWVAPSLVDLQINGYAGFDFQQDDVTEHDLLKACRALRADGCSRWLLTLITDHWSSLLQRLRHYRKLRAASPELQQHIAGWHIEGPFLSPEPGYAGAHDPNCMSDPTPSHVVELREAAGEDPVLLTLAPERPGAFAAIERAVQADIVVSLGHTNASAPDLVQALAAGATGFTHLGNGCPRLLDRHDNILWRVLDTPGFQVGFIVDQIHVSPPLLRLAHRTLKPDRIWYTTDAMAAAGAPPGSYRLGRLNLQVGPDQVVRQPGSELFAGSALRPFEGIRRAAAMLHRPWQEIWPHFSEVPARLMGWDGGLTLGMPVTSLYLIETNSDNQALRCQPLA